MCNVGEGWKVSGQLNKHGNGLLVMTSSAVDEFGGGVLQKKLMSCVNLELYKQKSIKEWRLGADLSPHVGPQPQSWRRGFVIDAFMISIYLACFWMNTQITVELASSLAL